MSSCGIRLDAASNERMSLAKMEKDPGTQRRTAGDDGGREGSSASVDQGALGIVAVSGSKETGRDRIIPLQELTLLTP